MNSNYAKNRGRKIEFKTESCQYFRDGRRIFYRIVPDELGWWERKYSNQWAPLYRALKYIGGMTDVFSLEDYKEMVFPLKTYGDVVDFLAKQKEIGERRSKEIEASRQERIARGEEWPD